MSWWSRGAASWRDLARDQLLEMLRPVRNDILGYVAPPVTPGPSTTGYLIKQDGGFFLKQDGGYFLRQRTPNLTGVVLDPEGRLVTDPDGQYVMEP